MIIIRLKKDNIVIIKYRILKKRTKKYSFMVK